MNKNQVFVGVSEIRRLTPHSRIGATPLGPPEVAAGKRNRADTSANLSGGATRPYGP
jgi:hypothetical protein